MFNVNGLNSPVKRLRVSEHILKNDPIIYYLRQTHFKSNDSNKLEVTEQRKIFHENSTKKKC